MIVGVLVFLVIFARDVLLGGSLGFSSDLDVFFILLVIPTVIETALGAAAAAALLPLLGISHRRHRDSGRVLWQVVAGLGFILFGLSLPLLVWPELTGRLLQFGNKPALDAVITPAVQMIGALLPLAGISAILSTALASSGKQRIPIMARMLPAAAVSIVAFSVESANLTVLVRALMAGIVLRFGLLLITLVRAKIPLQRPRPLWKGGHALIFFIGLPFCVFLLRNMHLVTERVLAMSSEFVPVAGSPGGVVSIVLAFLPLTPVLGLVGSVTAIVLLPFIMRSGLSGQKQEIARLMSLGIQLTLALSVPAAFCLWVFRQDIVTFMFGWGVISPDHLSKLASLLAYYAPGVVAFAVLPVLLRIMQITRSVRFQIMTAVGGFLLTFALQWRLLLQYGYQGIPLGTILGAYLTAGFLFIMLAIDLGRESVRNVLTFIGALLLSSAVSVWIADKLFQWLAERMEILWFPLLSAVGVFGLAFTLILSMFTWKRILDVMSQVSGATDQPPA